MYMRQNITMRKEIGINRSIIVLHLECHHGVFNNYGSFSLGFAFLSGLSDGLMSA